MKPKQFYDDESAPPLELEDGSTRVHVAPSSFLHLSGEPEPPQSSANRIFTCTTTTCHSKLNVHYLVTCSCLGCRESRDFAILFCHQERDANAVEDVRKGDGKINASKPANFRDTMSGSSTVSHPVSTSKEISTKCLISVYSQTTQQPRDRPKKGDTFERTKQRRTLPYGLICVHSTNLLVSGHQIQQTD